MPARSRTDSSPGLVWTVYDIYQLPHAKNRTCKASRGQKCGPVRCLGFTACQQGFYAGWTNRVGRGISPLKSCPQGPPLLHIHRQPYQLVCCNEDRVFKAFIEKMCSEVGGGWSLPWTLRQAPSLSRVGQEDFSVTQIRPKGFYDNQQTIQSIIRNQRRRIKLHFEQLNCIFNLITALSA